jgi:predicted FMN-binding regulatory protein PaiB
MLKNEWRTNGALMAHLASANGALMAHLASANSALSAFPKAQTAQAVVKRLIM